MRLYRIILLGFFASVAATIYGQVFNPLGLGLEISDQLRQIFQPQMYVEGDSLFVCTKQGLYSKDLSNNRSEWQLAGFEGIPVLDYVRRGDDIFALCFNDKNDVFLLSHDGGKTFEDVTPDDFRYFINMYGHVFWYFSRHPNDPNTFLLSSFQYAGIFLTTDFGETWSKLSFYTPDFMGFHTQNPEIIYECGGGGFTDEKTDLRISYDGGNTWEEKASCLPNGSEVSRIAFHPVDPGRWIAGGFRCVYTTSDNGKTWDTQHFIGDSERETVWRHPTYDDDNADIVYMAGGYHPKYIKLMCSTDGGITWNRPYMEPIKTTPYDFVFDMKQYRDKLLIYSQSDVYMVSKVDLIEQTTSLNEELRVKNEESVAAVYDLLGRKINSQLPILNSQLPKGIYIQNGKKICR